MYPLIYLRVPPGWKCGSLDVTQPYRPSWPVTRIALPFYHTCYVCVSIRFSVPPNNFQIRGQDWFFCLEFSHLHELHIFILRSASPFTVYIYQSPYFWYPSPINSLSCLILHSGTPSHPGSPRQVCRAICRNGQQCRNNASLSNGVCRRHVFEPSSRWYWELLEVLLYARWSYCLTLAQRMTGPCYNIWTTAAPLEASQERFSSIGLVSYNQLYFELLLDTV
jgi:hypothetical protein